MDNDIKREIENRAEENSDVIFQDARDFENSEQIDIIDESNKNTMQNRNVESDDATDETLNGSIEIKNAPICLRNEKVIEIGKKIGFYGLIVSMLVSLLFGVLSNYDILQNRLNILFVGFAVLMYGIQNIITYAAIKKCKCMNCSLLRKRLETVVIICFVAFIISVILFIVLTVTDIA